MTGSTLANTYRYGRWHVSSDIELPQLAPVERSGTGLRLSVVDEPLTGVAWYPDSTEAVRSGVRDGYAVFDYAGVASVVIDVPRAHAMLSIEPGCDEADVQHLAIDYVLPRLAESPDVFTLHATAVALRAGTVGFVAPSMTGKSTTALHLVRRGAMLVADDALVLDLAGDPVVAVPTARAVRMRQTPHFRVDGDGDATTRVEITDIAIATAETPLDRLVLLDPEASRVTTTGLSDLPDLLTQVITASHTGPSGRRDVLFKLTRLAAKVPIVRFPYRRTAACLDELHRFVAER